ncbi:PREDICTED: toll-like receptor 7 [Thamnophis sirtalis]|uniref:Toll-like receptor 7 n=1 Tax=Thamnophis sirtalis TaxID=35019 RepID=A0A6I9Z7Q8_9SAUR|nr:PREDICTED: toll-like receptor 7 [Thamnophis sirtalis]XP_013932169.1 PREDICTED: toll-like receptor 7 [Thamnophis sirtalis]XP_013932170.1 PREDICTED: toll-like receptor 7 [Thamnophis sirtalis]
MLRVPLNVDRMSFAFHQTFHLWLASRLIFFVISLALKEIIVMPFYKTLPCDVNNIIDTSKMYMQVDCSDRKLIQFPKDIPHNVTNLTLAVNRIPKISKSHFINLKKLLEIDFKCNCVPVRLGPKDHVCTQGLKIQAHAFSKLSSLKSLYLDGNQLSAIPQDLPPKLRLLSLEANSIFSIKKGNFSGLKNLEVLNLGQNCYYRNPCNISFEINELAFQPLTSLKVLSLKANNLSKVPQNLPSSLRELYLYNNAIRNITEHDLFSLNNLELLDLSGNCPRCHNARYHCIECPGSILINSKAFDSLKHLKELRLHSTSLQHVDSRWFKNTRNLQVLDLSQNYLARVIQQAHFLQFLPNLVELDLSFNYELDSYPLNFILPKTFSTLSNLQSLRIRGFVFKELNKDTIQNLIPLKKLNVLDFGTNFIRNVNISMFKEFQNLTTIILSFNKISLFSYEPNSRLYSVVNSSDDQYNGNVLKDMQYFRYDEYAQGCRSKNTEDIHSLSFVNETACSNYGKTLDLSRNNIFFIKKSDFQQLSDLKCLNISNNAMSQAFNGTEFAHLSSLKCLDLSNNRIDLLHPNAFQQLKELKVLNLSDNSYYFKAEGVTLMLNFTKCLVNLEILIMNGNEISVSTDNGMESDSIKTLEFRRNRLDILWKDGTNEYLAFFKNLITLENLDISENFLTLLPHDVFYNLPPKLKVLKLASNRLKTFNWGCLPALKNLEVLDLSNNQLTTVPHELSNCTKTLQTFILKNNKIRKLTDNFLKDAFFLRHLDLSFNKIKTIKNSSFPKNVINGLTTLYLNGNFFKCNCDIVWLVHWINETNVKIPFLATDVTCAGPSVWKDKSLILLDMHTCESNYSQILYLLSALFIILLMILPVICHLYVWDVRYIYHFCIAKLKGYKRLFSSDVKYDAFVVYDNKDAAVTEWVLKELIEKLEDQKEKKFNICLEERDWLPGHPLMENLNDSIQMSRKTIFVLTNSYIASGNFRTAFYMAHQRLVDEKVDVIILIILEKLLQMSKCLRLRMTLCRRSCLEWPTNPQSQSYFWQCLRNSLSANNEFRYNKLFKEMV